jgi:hypothetical protein
MDRLPQRDFCIVHDFLLIFIDELKIFTLGLANFLFLSYLFVQFVVSLVENHSYVGTVPIFRAYLHKDLISQLLEA